MTDSDDELNGIDLRCPACGEVSSRSMEQCPHCATPLDEFLIADIRPQGGRVAKIIALFMLILVLFFLAVGLYMLFSSDGSAR